MGDWRIRDRYGKPIFVGDTVSCAVRQYTSLDFGDTRRVLGIQDECIVLANDSSPRGTSIYKPENFVRIRRAEQPKEKAMLHIAIRINDKTTDEIMAQASKYGAASLEEVGRCTGSGCAIAAIIDTSAQSIKNRIAERIKHEPAERWLILSANTIGEISAPPVVFRGV